MKVIAILIALILIFSFSSCFQIIPDVNAQFASHVMIPPTAAFPTIITSNETVKARTYNTTLILEGQFINITGNNANKVILFSISGKLFNGTNFQCPSGQFFVNYTSTTRTFYCALPTFTSSSTFDTMQNIGGGQFSVYAGNTTKLNFQFKTISVSGSLTGTNGTNLITIHGAIYQNNTGQNLGNGSFVYSGMSGSILQFRSLLAGKGILLRSNSNNIIVQTNFQINNANCLTNYYLSAFSNSTGNFTCTPLPITSAIQSINGNTTSSQFINGTAGQITVTNSGNTHTIGLAIKVNNITCSNGYFVSSFNNSTGAYTCTQALNTAQGFNLGSNGVGVYSGNFNATELQFFKLLSGNNNCIFTQNSTNDILTCTQGLAITQINGQTGPLITISAGTGIKILTTVNAVQISNTGVLNLNNENGSLVLYRGMPNMTNSFTNSTLGITWNPKNNILLTNASAQNVTKPLTLDQAILGGILNAHTFQISNLGNATHRNDAVNAGQLGLLGNLTSGAKCANNQFIQYKGSNQTWICRTLINSTTAISSVQGTNLGTSGVGVFAGNFNNTELEFFKLISGNSNCLLSSNSTNDIISCNLSGITSINGQIGPSITINRGNAGMTITNSSNTITINAPNTAQIKPADNGESLFSSRFNATQNLLMTLRNSSGYLNFNHNTTSITPAFLFKLNNVACSSGFFVSNFNNSTGSYTCSSVSFNSGQAFKSNTFTCSSGMAVTALNNQTGTYTCSTFATTTGITTVNSQNGPAISINRGSVTNMSNINNSTNTISIQMKPNVVLTNGSNQTVTKPIIINDIYLGNGIIGYLQHFYTFPLYTGTVCLINQTTTCGAAPTDTDNFLTSINGLLGPAITILDHSNATTITNSSNIITLALKPNVVLTNGSAQNVTKLFTLDNPVLGGNLNAHKFQINSLANATSKNDAVNARQLGLLGNMTYGAKCGNNQLLSYQASNQTWICSSASSSGITSINGQNGPAITINRGNTGMTVTNSSNTITINAPAYSTISVNNTALPQRSTLNLFLPTNGCLDHSPQTDCYLSNYPFGTCSDGDVIISTNSSISGIKNYDNLTINSQQTLTVSSGTVIKICNTLNFGSSTSVIKGDGGGSGGGAAGGGVAGSGGAGGSSIFVLVRNIIGSGKISSNGTSGTAGSHGTGGASCSQNGGAGGNALDPFGTSISSTGGLGNSGTSGGAAGSAAPDYVFMGSFVVPAGSASGGGGGGASNAGASANRGGGGGGSGGLILFGTSGNIPSGLRLYVAGGNGGGGASASAASACGGGGGGGYFAAGGAGGGFNTNTVSGNGGGGAGGLIIIYAKTDSSTKVVSGGTAGSGGNGGASGNSGNTPTFGPLS